MNGGALFHSERDTVPAPPEENINRRAASLWQPSDTERFTSVGQSEDVGSKLDD